MARLGEHPNLEDGIARLTHALSTGQVAQLTCEDCEPLLPEYLLAAQEGREDEAQWQPVVVHLEACTHCLDAYADLVALGELADGVTGVEPPFYPAPKLDFIESRRVSERVQDLSDALADLWRQLRDTLASITSPQPLATAQAGMMGEPAPPLTLPQQALVPEDQNLEVKLILSPETTPEGEVPSLVRLDVILTMYDRLGDFSGAQVTLSWGDTMFTQETDTLGKVSFDELPADQIAHMRLTVTLPDK